MLGGSCAQACFASVYHQAEAVWPAQGCMLGSLLHGLQLTLSPVTPPPLSPQMCSELDVQDPEPQHSSSRTAAFPMCWEGTFQSSPSPMLSIELGPGWQVGTGRGGISSLSL